MPLERADVDFDHHSAEYASRSRELLGELTGRCPVAHTNAYGGFWIVSGYEEVAEVAHDDATYSSRNDVEPGSIFRGVNIPDKPGRSIPIELDPPLFLPYRKLLTQYFAPSAVARLEPRIQEIADALVDAAIEQGEIDLVHGFTGALPAIITMEFLGIPTDDWEAFSAPMHEFIYTPVDSPDRDRVVAGFVGIRTALAELIVERRAERRDDLMSRLVDATVDGEPMDDGTIVEICALIIAGGVDTTTAATSHSLQHLAEHPEDRQRLIDDPSLLDVAIEEFLRYSTPVQSLARTVTCDASVGGQDLTFGDRLLLSWAGANLDDREFEAPHELRIDRTPNRHMAFGVGIHRCIGSNLARAQMRIMITTVLERLPDYSIAADAVRPYPNVGSINGIISMPATFTPGPRLDRGSIT